MNSKRPVSLYNLMVLLWNVHKGSGLRQVGFEDADNTLEGLTGALSPQIDVSTDLIESAMWSCNLLDEQGKFCHPTGSSFDEFKKSLESRTEKFNTKYNLFE